MLTLSYTVEKNGIEIKETDMLMLSERQINNLMETLYEHGYDIISMEVK